MRFTQFMRNIMKEIALDRSCAAKMQLFSSPLCKGGWEIWLQCEAYGRIPDSRLYIYERETKYPGSTKKCDFLFINQHDQIHLWIELKVLLSEDITWILDRFKKDIEKITDLNLDKNKNSVGAVAVVPKKAYEVFKAEHVERFREGLDVSLDKIDCIAVAPGHSTIEGTLNLHASLYKDLKDKDEYCLLMSYCKY